MELKIKLWWDKLTEKEKELFIKYLYENSELLGFYIDSKTNLYKLK